MVALEHTGQQYNVSALVELAYHLGGSIWQIEVPSERWSPRINGKVNLTFKRPQCHRWLQVGIKVKCGWKLKTQEISFAKSPSQA